MGLLPLDLAVFSGKCVYKRKLLYQVGSYVIFFFLLPFNWWLKVKNTCTERGRFEGTNSWVFTDHIFVAYVKYHQF